MITFHKETLTEHKFDDALSIFESRIPEHLVWDEDQFNECLALKPAERHKGTMYGKEVVFPRYQQAYEKNYQYTGSVNNALPIPGLLKPLLSFAKETIFESLNGLLLNWYFGQDYIGEHRDSRKGLLEHSPIVTISFGETRNFRMSRGKGKDRKTFDLPAEHGSLIVIPWATNLVWKHSVPRSKKHQGHRISVTMRAFA